MKSITVSLFEKEDIQRLVEIEAECFSAPFKETDFLNIYESEISNVLVAKFGEKVAGHVSFTVIIDECQIMNFAVDPIFRRMGIADMLMESLISYAKEKGVTKYFLEVRESNLPAISLYKKHGFTEVGISKNHFSSPCENALLMNLEF